MTKSYNIPLLPLHYDLETKAVLKQLAKANRKLAELKGIAQTIPNENILISSLTLQEAKDSSAVENIVTTQDDLYRAGLQEENHIININTATKEVLRYREAIWTGFDFVRKYRLLTLNTIKHIQEVLEENKAGFRAEPGTKLENSASKEVVYIPPQSKDEIEMYMGNLEEFINNPDMGELD